MDEHKDLIEQLKKSPIIPEKEKDELIKNIKCLDGEQFDSSENRCLPCDYYGLIWDVENKLCKPMMKEDILKEQQKHLEQSKFPDSSKLRIVETDKNDIIGYLD